MVKLLCAIVDAAGSAFHVEINAGQSVGHLKKAIKAKKPNAITCDAKDLRLYLAKTADGAWLDSASVEAVSLDEHGHPQGWIQMDPLLWLKNVKYFGDNVEPSEGQVHVLVVVPVDASTSENMNKNKRKRMEDEDVPDAWIKAIKDEQITALPSTCDDLKTHLQREIRVKVPINRRLFAIILSNNTTGELSSMVDKLFEPEPRATLSDITAGILGGVIDRVGSGSELATEATYHHLWDSLIAVLLRRVSDGNFLRNTNMSGLYRPNMCFYYQNSNVCVFRGKEKASGILQVPVNELHAKLTWKYDAAPYIFGYAAAGLHVCLVVIRKNEKTEHGAKAKIIDTYDLGKLRGRLGFFLAMLNLSTLFRPVVELMQPLEIPEYWTIKRVTGVQIAFTEDCMVKTYPEDMPSDKIIRNLRDLHHQMKKHSVPNVVMLKKTNMKKRYIVLAPIGQHALPENDQQLLMALRDILKALVALHEIGLMHRDLRWENVLKYLNKGDKWFLIGFDEGASSSAAKVTHLKAKSHAPEISSHTHTVKVDIWSVGYLLKTYSFQDLPPELKIMKSQCLQKKSSSRPTAKSLLTVIESLLHVER